MLKGFSGSSSGPVHCFSPSLSLTLNQVCSLSPLNSHLHQCIDGMRSVTVNLPLYLSHAARTIRLHVLMCVSRDTYFGGHTFAYDSRPLELYELQIDNRSTRLQ